MTEPLSDEYLHAIRARAAKTAHPYQLQREAKQHYFIQRFDADDEREKPGWTNRINCYANAAEADFIVHAFVDVPALLAEVERLRAIVAQVRAAVETDQ